MINFIENDRAEGAAELVARNENEFLSDSQVELMRFNARFRGQVAATVRELREPSEVTVAVPESARTDEGTSSPAPAASMVGAPPPEQVASMLDWVLVRRRADWSDRRILRRASEWNISREAVGRVLKALTDRACGASVPAGEVQYSKRCRDTYLLVTFVRNADGRERFREEEATDVRDYPHRASPEQVAAARLLLRLGWSSHRIVIDDIIRSLTPPADKRAAQELELLLKVLGEHAPLAAALVKDLKLDADEADLLQDVAKQLCARRWAGKTLANEAAAYAFVQVCLRNQAATYARRRVNRPTLISASERLLTTVPVPPSQETQRAQELIDAIRPKLGPAGQFALDVWLGQIRFENYIDQTGYSRRTADRHFAYGMSELARLIRLEETGAATEFAAGVH
jgi:hypothetical protein